MKADLEEAQLAEKQMRHKLDQQSEALHSKTEELRFLTERAHETMSSEILELQVQKMEMESAMVKFIFHTVLIYINRSIPMFSRNLQCQI